MKGQSVLRKSLHRTAIYAVAIVGGADFSAGLHAQIISQDVSDNIQPQSRVFLDLYSNFRYTSNSLSVSNLPGGLGYRGKSDFIWQKGVGLTFIHPLAGSIFTFARVDAAHTNFFKRSSLNYVGLTAVGGIQISGQHAFAYVAASCDSERDDSHLRQFYSSCAPLGGASLMIGDPETRTGLEVGVRGAAYLGSKATFARYRELEAFASFESGSSFLRFRLRPHGLVRWYNVVDYLQFDGHDRRDYQAGVELALTHRSKHVEFGIIADPRANWSNFDQYRYWDIRVGPILRWRVGL